MQKLKDARTDPYYDYSSDELAAGYVSVLAVPGRPLQNREINSISGLIYGNVKKVTDVIIEDGTILSGCNFVKDDSDPNDIRCILEPGTIYFEGIVIPISVPEEGKVWRYNADPLLSEVPHGTAILCVEVLKYAVSELDDPTLTDPAENYESYGVAGASRLKYIANPQIMSETDFHKVSGVNKNIVSILRIEDGETAGPTRPKPIFGLMRDWIAQRTYDEVGNYIARGLRVSVKSSEDVKNVTNEYVIHISPGKVYMNGYEYFYNNKSVITTKSAIDVFSTGNVPEIHEYTTGIDTYKLNYDNVVSVSNIVGEVEITGIRMSARLNTDEIPEEYAPVASVVRLYTKNTDGSVTEVPDTLYYVDSNRKIVWTSPISTTPARPPLNSTYYIDIVKSDNFVEIKDYVLDNNSIKFVNPNKKPRAKRSFYVYYSWNVSRIDLLYIDENGTLKLINGIPNDESMIEEPKAPAGALTLASIYVKPGCLPEEYKVENFHVMRMPISELKSMKTRLDNIEYSLAMTQLETAAQDKHTSTESIATLKNIFTESFDNMTKADISHDLADSSIDIFSSQLKLPVNSTVVGINDITLYDASKIKVVAPYILTNTIKDSVSADWQNYATNYMDLNPFGNIKQKPGLSISPESTVYYDANYSYVKNVFIPTALFYSQKKMLNWWRKQNDNFFNSSDNDSNMAVNNQKITGLRDLNPPYLRSESISVRGINYPPNTEIEFYFDDKKVFASSTNTDYVLDEDLEEAITGDLKTDANGIFEGRFDLPNGIESGSHIVTARTIDKSISAFTPFEGKIEIKPLKIFTVTSKQDQTSPAMYLKKYSANYGDPIAQSVKFTSDTFVSKIDLFFQSKNADGYVFFTIRDLENGVPSTSVIYEKMISSDEILVSPTNTEIATEVVFDYPIYFAANKEYCFTLGSDKVGYKVWYAKVGSDPDVNTGNTVQAKNHSGTFYQGSGSGAWTSVNDITLSFTLYRTDFSNETVYYTDPITSDIGNFSMFNISADYAKLDSTDIEVYYSINLDDTEIYTDSNWNYIPFDEFIKIANNTSYTTEGMRLRFKFVLKSDSSQISPVINLNSLQILIGKYSIKGNYLTGTIQV